MLRKTLWIIETIVIKVLGICKILNLIKHNKIYFMCGIKELLKK